VNDTGNPIRVLFFGTPEFAATCLQELLADSKFKIAAVVTQPDREAGRGKKLLASPVKILAAKHNLPILQPLSIKKNWPGFSEEIKKLGPFDIGVVIAFGQILPQSMLDYPEAGCVNVHASILPRWRGAAPIHRAIMAGDSETGVGLMKMELGLDTGPVYSVERTRIEDQDSCSSLSLKLADIGAKLLRRDLPAIANKSLRPVPQPETGVTYAQKITNDEASIDWSRSAKEISLLVRGLNPAPGAFTRLRGLRLKIYSAQPVSSSKSVGTPGAIVRLSPTEVEVQCGTGVLALEEVQLEGKRRMLTEEFLRGGGLTREDILSSQQS
jgi:methionyl-tRNA formyltransferase